MNRAGRYLVNVGSVAFGRVVVVALCFTVWHYAKVTESKVFERCELAQLLRYGHGLNVDDVANWVCIAEHSSSFNTSAFGGNAKSGSHGLFQISDQYWCSPPGKGFACGISCDRLRDDNIADDLACARVIYDEHQRLSGDGYNAWVAYKTFCKDNPYEYVQDCLGKEDASYLYAKSVAANQIDDEAEDDDEMYSKKRGKVYGRCELAKELLLKYKMPMEEIPTWVCIAQHESSYDTSAVGRLNADGSADHGLFQISDLYWCSHKGGRRKACGVPCSKFLDADISDDIKCVKQIHKEHTRISGNGFTAWTVYNAYCHGQTSSYIRGCFDGIDEKDGRASEEHQNAIKPVKATKKGKQKPHGKVYEPCELAEELRTKHGLPEDQIATWVCIAKHESEYNTSAIGYGDHGLFQISDIYWCSPPGKGWACGLSCADLEDSDISDDVECIRKIYAEHTRLSGDGFKAWTVYPRYCSQGRSEKYISHCSASGKRPRPAVTAPSFTQTIKSVATVNRGKVYGRCELAQELRNKHDMSMNEIPTWVCIAHHESNYDTSAVGRLNADGSADHGLFQISDLYWCSHKEGHRKACGLPCSKLLDNDLSDDIDCIKQIHDEHTRISGNGFTAWTVYNPHCKERTEQYIRGCFDGSASAEDFKPAPRIQAANYKPKNRPKGKVYGECELAKELRDKHRIPKEQIPTWVCIAKHQSGLNTSSAFSDVHGLFHISDQYWCSPPGKGEVCGLHCSDLEDSDISDDVECIKKIHLEHQKLSGNGFSAWVAYAQHCSNGRADEYVRRCSGFETISHGNQQDFNKYSIQAANKPVFDHAFNANPFLKHVKLVNSDAAAKLLSQIADESVSASEEVDDVVLANPEYISNPFLKKKQPEYSSNPFLKQKEPDYNSNPFLKSNEPKDNLNEYSSNPFLKNKINEYSLNPFLKNAKNEFITNPFLGSKKSQNKLPIEEKKVYIESTTSHPNFFPIPITPTPTLSQYRQTYQPKNEEKAKYEAFKALFSQYLPHTTQTPRADRLQTYQLKGLQFLKSSSLSFSPTKQTATSAYLKPIVNAFTSFTTTPSSSYLKPIVNTFTSFTTTPSPTSSYLKPNLNTFTSFTTTPSPTTQSLKSAISSLKPNVLPTQPTILLKSSTQPFLAAFTTTSKTPVTSIRKESGRYDPGRYDSGRFDSGRYDPGKYNQPKVRPTLKSASSGHTDIPSSAHYPTATPALQIKVPTTIKITSSGVTTAFARSTHKPASQGSLSTSTYAPFGFTSSTKKAVFYGATPSPANIINPVRPFVTNSGSYGYLPKSDSSEQIRSNDLYFASSLNSKRSTTQSEDIRRTSFTTKRETKSSTSPTSTKKPTTTTKPTVSNSYLQKTNKTSSIIATKPATRTTTKPQIVPTSKVTTRVTLRPTVSSSTKSTTKKPQIAATSKLPLRPTVPTTKSPTTRTSTTARSKSVSSTIKPTSTTKPKPLPSNSSGQIKTTSKTTFPIPAVTAKTTSRPYIRPTTTKSATTNKANSRPTTSSPTRSLTAASSLVKTTSKPSSILKSSTQKPQVSLNPSKVTRTSSPINSKLTSKPPLTEAIRPTKASKSLFTPNINLFDLYFKLYGVNPTGISSTSTQQMTKPTQPSLLPSRTS